MSKDYKEIIKKMVLPPYVKEIIEGGAEIIIPDTKEHLFDLALGGKDNMTYDVNFDVNGNVIVGEHTPLIVDDVPPAVRDEALRIIKSSGSIVNRRGEPVYLAVPVILGQ